MMTTMTDAQAAAAIRAHHEQLAGELRDRVAAVEATVREGQPHAAAQARLLAHLDDELLPHAAAEEATLYAAAETGLLAMLVRAMKDEHVDIVGRVGALRGATEPIEVAGGSAALLALFESHLHKENELLVPALVDDPSVALGTLLEGMHELVG